MQRASHSPIATQLTDSRSRAKTQASQHLNGWVEGIEQTHWKQRWAGGSEPGPRPTVPQGLWQEVRGGTGQFHGFVPLLPALTGPVQVSHFPDTNKAPNVVMGNTATRGAVPRKPSLKGSLFLRRICGKQGILKTTALVPPSPPTVASILAVIRMLDNYLSLPLGCGLCFFHLCIFSI